MLARKYEKEKPHTVQFSINKFMKKYSNNKGEIFFKYLEWRYLMKDSSRGKFHIFSFTCPAHSNFERLLKNSKNLSKFNATTLPTHNIFSQQIM